MSKPLTTTQLADTLGVDRRTIQRWAREGRLPHIRIGSRTIRFLPNQVEEIMHEYTQAKREQRPEADVRNDRHQSYITVVPMRRPNDAA
jgi:excisionase family DNA binding protein